MEEVFPQVRAGQLFQPEGGRIFFACREGREGGETGQGSEHRPGGVRIAPEGDFQRRIFGQFPFQLVGRAAGHFAAMVDDEQVVAHLLDFGQDVGAEEDGVIFGQRADEGTDLQDLLGVETHGGLIQNEELGEAQQSLGKADALAVALGEVADEPSPDAHDAGHLHDPVGLGAALFAGDFFQPGGEEQVFLAGHIHVERGQLGQIADGALDQLRFGGDAVSIHQHLALGGAQVAGHDVHGGGLAGAVGAQKAENLAVGHGEAQMVHSQVGAIALDKIAYFDQNRIPPLRDWRLRETRSKIG